MVDRLRVLIVDDEPLARQRLSRLLADCTDPPAMLAGEAANAADALACASHQRLDVVLADIHMPGADGLRLAQALRALPHPPAVIFVTAYTEHAVAAFEVEATDYLTKPVRLERLQQSLQKVKRLAQSGKALEPDFPDNFLLVESRHGSQRIPLSEVLYFKAELKYVTVRTATESHLIDQSLGELEARYPAQFVRIHRNALVARHAIRELREQLGGEDGWMVQLQGIDEPLAVSRRQLALVRALIRSPNG
ncbi:MAG: LytTR family DNA-binding domain-containing protein [Rhodoferax sp.]